MEKYLVKTVNNIEADASGNVNINGSGSALLPNGIKVVTESRDLQADDAGWILLLQTEDINIPTVLNIPYPSPLEVNKCFALVVNNSNYLTCGYASTPDGLTLVSPMLGENVLFTTTETGGGNYTFPVSTAAIDDKTALRYLYDNISLRGTAILSSGTVTVTTSSVKTDYKIYVSVNTPSGTQGFLSAPVASIVDATSFVINSTNAGDNSAVNWWIVP